MGCRRKGIGIFVLGLLVVAGMPIDPPAARAQEPPVPALEPAAPLRDPAAWSFVHVTDTHVGSRAGNAGFPSLVADLVYLRPDFIVNGGDLTELGGPEQYRVYKEMAAPLAGIPQHFTMGNHESRWLDPGKGFFRAAFGEPTHSFDHRGVHFVVLDVTVAGETHGHFDPATLDWLRRDLERTGRDTPVVVFSHHPIAYDAQRFIDNDDDFLDAIAPYNVRAVFTGHGHADLRWVRNGVDFFMTAAGMDGGYKRVVVRDGRLVVQKRVDGGLATVAEVPLARPPRGGPSLRIASPEPAADGTVTVVVVAGNLPDFDRFELRWDLDKWRPLQPAGSMWTATIPNDHLAEGWHTVRVRVVEKDGRVWSAARRVRISLPGGPTRLLWERSAGGAILAAPALDGGTAYAGGTDGRLYAVDLAGGGLRWTAEAGGAVSGPVVVGGRVVAGAGDGHIYAWDAASGRLLWRRAVGGAVVAAPVVDAGRAQEAGVAAGGQTATAAGGVSAAPGHAAAGATLYVADAAGRVTALDPESGAVRWTFEMGAPIRAAPALGGGRLYIGSWGLDLVALDAATGGEVWRRRLARQIYFAPSAGSPLYAFGRVFVTTQGDARQEHHTLHALDARTGEVLWQAAAGSGFATPVLQGESIVVSSTDGRVIGFNPFTGEKVWTAKTGYGTYESSPVPFGDGLVMGSLVGILVGLAPTGAATATGLIPQDVAWRVHLGDGFLFARAAAAGERVLIGSLDGRLYAIAAPRPALPPRSDPPFRDLAGHWAAADVARMARYGLVSGYSGEGFRPERAVTRAEFAALLDRTLGRRAAPEGFASLLADMDGHWAAEAVRALEARGLVQGTAGTDGRPAFEPDRNLTRAEAAVMLARAAGWEAAPEGFAGRLADLGGHWAAEAVRALEARGLVQGTAGTDGRPVFEPDRNLTRAEAAVMLWRLLAS